MKSLVCLVTLIASLISITNGGYLITTPRRYTRPSKSQICVLLTDGGFTSEDKLDFNFNPLSKDPTIPHATIPVILPQGQSHTCFEFNVPKTDEHRGEITIKGTLAGLNVMEKVNVTMGTVSGRTFVQTDKYYYKPGQDVMFRILSLSGPFLKVSTDPYQEIYIHNPSGTRIAQWKDVNNNGLVHLSFQLAEEPEQGTYSINVRGKDGRSDSTNFLVEDYVLPTFEVTIEPVGIILGDDTQITLKVCAKYTFGQGVEGTASLNVKVGTYQTYANITQEKPITGCQDFTFDTKELRFDDNNCHIRVSKIQAYAKIVETGTNTELEGSNENIRVARRAVKFDVQSPKFIQKRFLPIYVKAKVSYSDNSPAPNELVSVCTYYNGTNVCKNITTDKSGAIDFVVPNFITGGIELTAPKYGRLERNFNDVMEKSRHFFYLHRSEKFTEAHNASLSIYTDEEVKCSYGSGITFTLPLIYIIGDATLNPSAEINVQVMSRGQIQFFERKTVQFQRKPLPFEKYPYLLKEQNIPQDVVIGVYDFVVNLPASVSPNMKVVAWFTKHDGAVIADTKELDVTPCLNHAVDMSWSVGKGEPGSMADLKLTAQSGSICSYGVVDKSVELLSNPNDALELDNVLRNLYNYESRRWDGENYLNLDFCLKKYNRTLDVPEQEKPKKKETGPSAALSPSTPSRTKRSFFPPIRGTENEAADIFRNAGFYVFSNLDLESEFCNKRIEQALKDKIVAAQIQNDSGNVAHKIANRRPVSVQAQAFAAPAPASAAGGFGGQADLESDTVTEPSTEARERSYFPETWLWQLVNVPESGQAIETLTLPDTITEWIGKAVCVHPDRGLGLSQKASIITFTSFFVTLTLPPNAKRGEEIPVKISVFNYEKDPLPVEVIMDKSQDFTYAKRLEKGVRQYCIPPNSQRTETIIIKPINIDDIEIAVNAASVANNNCRKGTLTPKSDRLVRSIPIEAEGFIRETSQTNYLCGEDFQESAIPSMSIQIPPNIVPDSARAKINVVGDLVGLSFANLHNLVNLPYGCGEQNLIRMAPSIYALKYLKTANRAKDVQNRALELIEIGYQRQLTFRRRSGSFSTFGDYDDTGSTWLTAFVLKTFAEARPYITIDNEIMTQATRWLKARQNKETGCFEARGKVINKKMLGGLSSPGKTSLLTAYVLIALIETEGMKDKKTIDNAIKCIKSNTSPHVANDPYHNALVAYSLTLAKDPEAKTRVADLIKAAITDEKTMRWEIPDSRNRALEVETAAYALLALLASDPKTNIINSRKVARYLSNNRNNYGGFVSTQDTVMALQALSDFETRRVSSVTNLNIKATTNELNSEFIVTEDNKLLQQTEPIPSVPTDVQLGISGTGCASVQAVLRYNILTEEKDSSFKIGLTNTPTKDKCGISAMNICTSYTLPDGKSNMAVLEVSLLTGYIPVGTDLAEAVANSPSVKRYEYDNRGKVTFYLDEVTSKEICVTFKVEKDIDVDNLQERYVRVYDYYQKEYSTEQKYNVDTTMCNVP